MKCILNNINKLQISLIKGYSVSRMISSWWKNNFCVPVLKEEHFFLRLIDRTNSSRTRTIIQELLSRNSPKNFQFLLMIIYKLDLLFLVRLELYFYLGMIWCMEFQDEVFLRFGHMDRCSPVFNIRMKFLFF